VSDLIVDSGTHYELLDSGEGEKLERIAGHLVRRPSPQAIWPKAQAKSWKQAGSVCHRTKDGGGRWEHAQGEPQDLWYQWQAAGLERSIALQVRFTAFGHCGVFVEHTAVWQRLADHLRACGGGRLLNLFGYTGGASVVAAAVGAEVFHVDSAKGVLDWGKQNLQRNPDLPGRISWIHDDARTSLAFSQKRGFTYDAILLDPPSWGHGVDRNAVWDFGTDSAALIAAVAAVCAPGALVIFTSHTPGVQQAALVNLLAASGLRVAESGELGLRHLDDARILPAGIYAEARAK
jgi:23S rRNA (cytosine1962-C5)-methyltransferase